MINKLGFVIIIFLAACASNLRSPSSAHSAELAKINGKRAVKTTDAIYVFDSNKIYALENENVPITQTQIFYEEAKFQIKLAQYLNFSQKSDYSNFLKSLELKLDKLSEQKKITHSNLENVQKQLTKLFSQKLNPVHKLNTYSKLIFDQYNPKQASASLSNSTLIVPLTRKWFESNPKLQKFFNLVWNPQTIDVRIYAGASGEGVTNLHSNDSDDSFNQMRDLLTQTRDFVIKNHVSGPEAQWLIKFAARTQLNHYERMIFIHPETWDRNIQQFPWAEFIPVDQSIANLPADYLFSVLIHELNVNSPNYLGSDTHLQFEDVERAWSEPVVGELTQQNAAFFQKFFGLNPHLMMIYLSLELNLLEDIAE